MITNYDISDFQVDCYAFNKIAGKDKLCSLKDIEFQYNLIQTRQLIKYNFSILYVKFSFF